MYYLSVLWAKMCVSCPWAMLVILCTGSCEAARSNGTAQVVEFARPAGFLDDSH